MMTTKTEYNNNNDVGATLAVALDNTVAQDGIRARVNRAPTTGCHDAEINEMKCMGVKF